jgi:hypothetical protein
LLGLLGGLGMIDGKRYGGLTAEEWKKSLGEIPLEAMDHAEFALKQALDWIEYLKKAFDDQHYDEVQGETIMEEDVSKRDDRIYVHLAHTDKQLVFYHAHVETENSTVMVITHGGFPDGKRRRTTFFMKDVATITVVEED